MKKKIIICGIVLMVFFTIFTVCVLQYKKENVESYDNPYYSITLPKNLSINEINETEAAIFLKKDKVGSISFNPRCNYCATLESIVTNWFGMHAYIKESSKEQKLGNYNRVKVKIAYEQSPSEVEKKVPPMEDEIHYIYTDNVNLLIDLSLDTKVLSEEEIKLIVEALKIK